MRIWSCALPTPPVPSPWLVRTVTPIWERMRASPRHAGPTLSEALRVTRSLGSRDRRLAGDLLLGLIRHERALARIHADPFVAWTLLATDGPPDLPDEPDAYAVATSLPDDLAAEWWSRLGPDAAVTLARTLAERAPVALRWLGAEGDLPPFPVAVRRVGARGIVLEAGANVETWETFKDGRVIVQDLGSQALVDAVFPGPGARVMDLCAGAGGKSLALAAMGADVQAWDVRKEALRELEKRAARSGLDIRIGPPQGRYDLVLVDAPCSGTGVLRRHPENRWKLRYPVEAQREVLATARRHADRVAYATCALTLRENEEIVGGPGETLWPESGGRDGFFLARLSS